MQDAQTKLLERVLGQNWPTNMQVTWTIGELPPIVEKIPPLLGGVRVIGTVERREKPSKPKIRARGMGMYGYGPYLTLFLEADGPLEAVKSAYIALLEREGWAKMPPIFGDGGGFQPDFAQQPLEFRLGETFQGVSLSFEQHIETVWVNLGFSEMPPEMLEQRLNRPGHWDDRPQLPQLTPIPDLDISFSGGGSGGNEQHSSAYIESELSLETVGQAFTAQISEQGFKVLETVKLERTFITTFHKLEEKGDVWGSLTLQTMEEQLYSALLSASRASSVV